MCHFFTPAYEHPAILLNGGVSRFFLTVAHVGHTIPLHAQWPHKAATFPQVQRA
jgi:hypothetical protein